MTVKRLRAELLSAMAGDDGPLAAADRLCGACVALLGVDGASVSVIDEGSSRGTFGSSGAVSRRLDELQFTFGEGPCLDAVAAGLPVLVPDLDDITELRWPAFRDALTASGVCAVFALPVRVAAGHVGALDLYRNSTGPLSDNEMAGALLAAQFAALPLEDLMSAQVNWAAVRGGEAWAELESLERLEVYQATGMIMEAARVSSTDALVRLRAYAFAHDTTASQVAWDIVERRLPLDRGPWADRDGG